jgi:hypothetical protein
MAYFFRSILFGFIIYMYCIVCVQRGNLPNEEINSYYKGYPVFENLRMLRLFWLDFGILDWGYDVMTMLQNCPKLEAFIISKVCWSR